MEEKMKSSTLLRIPPSEIFQRVIPFVYVGIVVINSGLKFYQFGIDGGKSFDVLMGLIGLLLIEFVTFGMFFAMKGKKVASYLRFLILYMAFVPHVSLIYLERMQEYKLWFELRENVEDPNLLGAIGMWLPEVSSAFCILVPIVILLIGAWKMNGLGRKLPRYFFPFVFVMLLCAFLDFFFPNLGNCIRFIINLLLVCIAFDLWEQIRTLRSMEPTVMVAWAEVLLFTALECKGVADIFG